MGSDSTAELSMWLVPPTETINIGTSMESGTGNKNVEQRLRLPESVDEIVWCDETRSKLTRSSDVTRLVRQYEELRKVPVLLHHGGYVRSPGSSCFVFPWSEPELCGASSRDGSRQYSGSRPSANLSFYTAGPGFTRVKRRSSLRHIIRSRRSPISKHPRGRFGAGCIAPRCPEEIVWFRAGRSALRCPGNLDV